MDAGLKDIAQKHGIVLALKFGSSVTRQDHPRSDVDLAILLDRSNITLREHSELLQSLQPLFPDRELDLALIAHADPLFRHFDHGVPQYIFQWHAYTFAPPPGAVPLAWTRSCRNQAYRLGDCAWGLQFHLEADEPLIARWLDTPAGRSEIETHWDARRIARIRAATRRYLPHARPLADRVFGEFIRVFPARRLAALPSR